MLHVVTGNSDNVAPIVLGRRSVQLDVSGVLVPGNVDPGLAVQGRCRGGNFALGQGVVGHLLVKDGFVVGEYNPGSVGGVGGMDAKELGAVLFLQVKVARRSFHCHAAVNDLVQVIQYIKLALIDNVWAPQSQNRVSSRGWLPVECFGRIFQTAVNLIPCCVCESRGGAAHGDEWLS